MLLYSSKNKKVGADSLNDKTYFFLSKHNFLLSKAQWFLVVIGMSCYLAGLPQILEAMPTQADWNAISFAIQQSKPCIIPDNCESLSFQNDWDYGYWIAWAGGNPSSWGGGETNNFFGKGIRLTMFYQLDCKQLKIFETFKVYTDQKTVSVWKC
jgi:hypothetical protein